MEKMVAVWNLTLLPEKQQEKALRKLRKMFPWLIRRRQTEFADDRRVVGYELTYASGEMQLTVTWSAVDDMWSRAKGRSNGNLGFPGRLSCHSM